MKVMLLKRLFDMALSAIILAATAPLFLVIAVVVRLTSPGPIFYKANRVGQNGKPFHLYKFRSMVVNADKIGPAVTGAHDPRLTRIGRFLRLTKLDELPQLINVMRGDMSIVGPRPEAPRYVAHYNDEQKRVLAVRPGITSPASIAYRHEADLLTGDDWETYYIETIMPAKIALDLPYVEKASIVEDLKIVLRTIVAILPHSWFSRNRRVASPSTHTAPNEDNNS